MGRHQPGQRASVVTSSEGVVDGPGSSPADVGVEGDDGVDGRVDCLDAGEVGVEQLARRHRPLAQQPSLLDGGQLDQLARSLHAGNGTTFGRGSSLGYVTMVRVALAQLNPLVGDLDGNLAKLADAYDRAEAAGCDVVAFPELSVTGYPPEDLVMKPAFVADNEAALGKLAARTRHCAAVVGFVEEDRDLFNAAAICAQGEVLGTYRKRLLPNYAVFDEARYFTPGNETDPLALYVIGGVKVGISICEDVWSPDGPLSVQADGGAELAININASPYHRGKAAYRERMLATRAADSHAALVYVNQVGGQDELVFDGCSLAFDAEGNLIARGPQFVEDLMIVDVPVPAVYRQRLLDPRGRVSQLALPSTVVTQSPVRHEAADEQSGRHAAVPGGRAVRGARARHPRLLRQERLHRRRHRTVRWHRLDAGRRHRRRCAGARARARRVDAVAVLERPFEVGRRAARRPTWGSTFARSRSSLPSPPSWTCSSRASPAVRPV